MYLLSIPWSIQMTQAEQSFGLTVGSLIMLVCASIQFWRPRLRRQRDDWEMRLCLSTRKEASMS